MTQIKAKTNTPVKFFIRVDIGDGKTKPVPQVIEEINKLLKSVKDDFEVR